MSIRYPKPLRPGSTIAVTAPSSGIDASMRPRFSHCERTLREAGYEVRVGACLDGEAIVSAPAADRAAELVDLLLDPTVSLVMPPWGGELLINILPLIDFEALSRREVAWFAGWSDGSTFALPLATLSGVASLHGMNFMDSAFTPAPGVAAWRDVLALPPGGRFTQASLPAFQDGFKDYETHPSVSTWELTQPTRWKLLRGTGPVEVSGRLLGGCLDVISRLVGTRFGEVDRFARERAPEGLLLYLENCEAQAAEACRALHQLRLAGWLDRANAILIGRTKAKPTDEFTQADALADALGSLDVPVLYDVDISHVPPQHMIINGAMARVRYEADGRGQIAQTLA